MTRKKIETINLKPNLTLKKSIESIKDKLSSEQLKINSKIVDQTMRVFNEKLDEITLKCSQKDEHIFIKIDVPEVEKRPPVDIVLCIDVSGSMGMDAPIKGNDGSTTSYGISVLSLTIAAAKTILNTLNDEDNISIVTYTDTAETLFTDCPCSIQNKETIITELDRLTPKCTTNIWDGLKTSLDILRLNSPPNKLKVIKLLTDGQPTVEPNRGHEYELTKYFKTNDFMCMINCYGFGYNLKSDLLDNISRISGGDGYSFIPDSSLLGNIFIHGISNFFTTAINNVPIKVKFTNGAEKEFHIDSLKYGRSKNIVFKDTRNVEYLELKIKDKTIKSDLYELIDEYYYEQLYRYKAYKCIENCIKLKKYNDEGFKTELDNLILEISFNREMQDNEYIQNILFDLEGQVREALNITTEGQMKDFFTRWGIHYLRSLKTAYENEICNNFKDKGVSNFTGELFENLRDEISDIFDNMPPPKKTSISLGFGSPNGATTPSLQSMSAYRNMGGGCCAGDCRIRMSDNSFKQVKDLNIGEEVISVDTKSGNQVFQTGIIKDIIITKCVNDKENMVCIDNLKITPYHPIIEKGENKCNWQYPKNISVIELIECSEIYTFVLDNRQSVLIEDFIYATLGHNLENDEVIQHKYFGTDKVINDLNNMIRNKNGKIYLTKDMYKRSKNNEVSYIGYSFNLKLTDIMENFFYSNL
jgi:Mg-chelatase subunit ChlD